MQELLAGSGHVFLQRAFLTVSAVFAVLALYRVLLSAVHGRGLLSADTGSQAEPERLGMVIATLVAAGAYAQQCLAVQAAPLESLPAPHYWILWAAGGGHASYLAGKMLRLH